MLHLILPRRTPSRRRLVNVTWTSPRNASSAPFAPTEQGRRTHEAPERYHWIADRTPERRVCDERHDRVAVEMVNDVPPSVKKPADADEGVGAKPSERDVRRNGRVRKLPRTQTSAEIRRACAGNHDCIEFATMWLADERNQRDKDESDDDGRHEIDHADGRAGNARQSERPERVRRVDKNPGTVAARPASRQRSGHTRRVLSLWDPASGYGRDRRPRAGD